MTYLYEAAGERLICRPCATDALGRARRKTSYQTRAFPKGDFGVFALFFGKDLEGEGGSTYLAQMYITTCGADCSKETPRKAEKVGVGPPPLAMMFLYFCRKHCKDVRHKKESSSYLVMKC